MLCEQQRAPDLEEGGGGSTCEVSATSAGACLSIQPGLDRAETHERLPWLAGRFPFSLHEAVPESEGVPAASTGLRIPNARSRFRIQNLQSQCASLRGSELLVRRERDVFFSHTTQDGAGPPRSFHDQKLLVSVMGSMLHFPRPGEGM